VSSLPPGNTPAQPPQTSRRVGRRAFIGAVGALGAAAVGGTAVASAALRSEPADDPSSRPVFIGTFGGGIMTGTYNPFTGALTKGGGVEDVTDPSFLTLSASGEVLYSLDTVGKEGGVRAFSVGEDGSLTALGETQSTGGAGVTHLSVHPGGKHLLSANYDSGSVAVHPIKEDGSVGARTDLVRHKGSGPDPDRQAGPHAHQIVAAPKGDFVIAVDLGNDTIYTYKLDADKGTLAPVSEVKSAAGAGPRHLAFNPDGTFAYVVNELDSTITVYGYDSASGKLTRKDSISTLPEGTHPNERNYPAELVISQDGRFVYVSNRGHDSVAWLSAEGFGASLRVMDTISSGGRYPRHISIPPSGDVLWAGNEKGNTVGIFTVDKDGGSLQESGKPFSTTSPVCVLPG
jgi:6-phosphogluconolactonase